MCWIVDGDFCVLSWGSSRKREVWPASGSQHAASNEYQSVRQLEYIAAWVSALLTQALNLFRWVACPYLLVKDASPISGANVDR